MSIVACSVENCEDPRRGKGFCSKHYQRLRFHGDPLYERTKTKPTCSIADCGDEVLARTWCGTHYRRWQRIGSTETTRFIKHPCKMDGCKNMSASKRGWCATHYSRWSKTGSPGLAAVKEAKKPTVDGKRQCSGCLEWLTLDGFNAGSYPNTLASKCRPCQRLANIAWREANPTYWQEWQKANAQKTRDISNRRRAQKFSREFEKIDRDVVFERDAYECKLCSKPLDMAAKFPHPLSPTLDHIVPLNKGGHHLYVNLQAAHFRCNTAKGDRVA